MPAPVFVQNSPRKNRERNDPALSLLPKQGISRHSELPFDSLRQEGFLASAAALPSASKNGESEQPLPQLRKSLG